MGGFSGDRACYTDTNGFVVNGYADKEIYWLPLENDWWKLVDVFNMGRIEQYHNGRLYHIQWFHNLPSLPLDDKTTRCQYYIAWAEERLECVARFVHMERWNLLWTIAAGKWDEMTPEGFTKSYKEKSHRVQRRKIRVL